MIDRSALPAEDPLGWLVQGAVESVPAAGYKYVIAHPAMGTVLSGTANIEHLEANVRAILGPALPDEDMAAAAAGLRPGARAAGGLRLIFILPGGITHRVIDSY